MGLANASDIGEVNDARKSAFAIRLKENTVCRSIRRFNFDFRLHRSAPLLLLRGRGSFLFFEDCGGSGDAIAFFEAQQADALRRAARFANLAGVNADYFALVGDDHYVGILADLHGRDDRAVAVCGFQVDDALAAARRDAIFRERRALPVALFGNGEHQRRDRFADVVALELFEVVRFLLELLRDDGEIGLHGFHADDVVALREVHAVHAASGAAHGANFGLAEENRLAVVAREEDHLRAVGEFCADQLVARVEVDGDDAGRARVGKFGDGGFLHGAAFRRQENVAALFFQVARGDDGRELLAFLKADDIVDGFSARGCGSFGNFVHLQPVDAAFRREQQNVGMRRRSEKVLHEIVVAGLGADAAFAAARLMAIGFHGGALDVAGMADGDGHLFVFDQVFELDFLDAVDDLRAAIVSVSLKDFAQLGDDHGFQFLFAREDFRELGDALADLGEFLEDFIDGELGEAVELQLEDGVYLNVTEAEPFARPCHRDGVLLRVEFDAANGGFLA